MEEEKKGLIESGVEAVGNAVKAEVTDTIQGAVDTVKGAAALTKGAADLLGEGIDWLTSSKEEKEAKRAEKEAQEAAAKAQAEKKAQEEAAAKAAEEERLAQLKDTYILHSAMITCSCAVRPSRVQIPISHGVYIHGIDQLNIGDSKALVNIQSFGVCTSPANPSVQAAAAKIQKEVQEREKGFIDKVLDFFCKKPESEEKPGEDLVKMCAGVCTPIILTDWIDGKEDVLIDGKPALLGRCTLACAYNGAIEIYTDGVCKEMIDQVKKESEKDLSKKKKPIKEGKNSPNST